MITPGQKEKAIQFRQFHTLPPILVLPNAWDAASARILEWVGFRAIATTSSGVAAALGYPDGQHRGSTSFLTPQIPLSCLVLSGLFGECPSLSRCFLWFRLLERHSWFFSFFIQDCDCRLKN